MMVLPAIDLRDGACVQLVGGSYAQEKVRLTDVVGVARRFQDAGLRSLHVVDLDAALGKGSNREVIKQLASIKDLTLQVGGGIRERNDIERLLQLGVSRVVIGTRGIEDRPWLEDMSGQFPKQLILAADVRAQTIVTKGWTHDTGIDVSSFLERCNPLPLGGVLVTAVHVEGQLLGIDRALFADCIRRTALPIIASGGVTTLEDLSTLKALGASAAVVGMALYTDRISLSSLTPEFAS
jgi:phosphoribosyl isomerase A